jgi:hypothetical protein
MHRREPFHKLVLCSLEVHCKMQQQKDACCTGTADLMHKR